MRKLKQWHLISSDGFLQLGFIFIICIIKASTFQFKAPYVSVNPTTINTLAQYTVTLQRQFTQDIASTPWNTQLVPAGSQLIVNFPVEFIFSGNESCDLVLIGGNMPNTFSFVSNPGNRTITVSGAIDTAQYISDVTLVISNVLNPSPALTTSAFLASVGFDNSANDPFAAVTLTPGAFSQPMATFSPSTANTTGNLIITVTSANKMPIGSAFTVTFPSSLSWAEDVAGSTHRLPLGSTMSCSSLSSSISTGLTCSGQISSAAVTIIGLSNVDISSQSILKFSINNLFSPPTQSHIDNVVVTSIDSRGYQIDTSTISIQGLTAKVFTDLTVVSTTASKPINSNIGLRISFTLLDTVTNLDYFQVQFPIGTTITYTTSLSTFSIATGSVTYNSSTGVMTFTQTALSQVRTAGFLSNITFLAYRTPNSTKPTDPILFRVMKNGYAKMKGSASPFIADPKLYTFAITANDTRINMPASYTIPLNLADGLDKTGYIMLIVPPQLIILPSLSVSISSSSPSSINLSPVLTLVNSTIYAITNLNKTSSSLIIPIQNLNITVTGVQNPNAGMTISNFSLSVYYSNENYLTATAQQTNTIAVVGGTINASVSSSASITASSSDLQVTITIQNSIPALGRITITIPPQVSYSTINAYSLVLLPSLNSVPLSALPLPFSFSTISFQPTTSVAAGSTLKLTMSPIVTPASTQPSSLFSISTANQNNVTIDSLGVCSCRLTMTAPNSFTLFSLSRGSSTNWDSTVYNISINMPGLVPVGAWINFTFPTEVTNSSVLSTLLVSTSTNSTQTIPATVLGTAPLRLSLALPSAMTNMSDYYISFSSLQNPASLKPTLTGLQAVVGITSFSIPYLCSKGETLPIQNSQTADFLTLAYSYTSGFLYAEANFTCSLNLVAPDRVAYLSYQLDNSLRMRDQSVSGCSSPQIAVTCTILSTAPSIVKIAPTSSSTFSVSSIQIVVGILLTPTSYSSSYSASMLTSYDSSNFAVSRNSTLIRFTPACNLPCRECVASQPNQCLSCYSAASNVTTLIYFAQAPNQTYGSCYSACPSGYYLNTGSCSRCSANCLECTSATVCTSCPVGTFLNPVTSACAATCPNGMFPSGSLCAACPVGCLICNSATLCSSCASGYFLYNSGCSTSCPASYTIANTSSNTCDACSSSCTTCAVSVTSCTSCSDQLVLASSGCLSSCPTANMIPINGTCTVCSATCATCSLGTTNCTSCNITNINNRYLYYISGQCLPACPSLYYGTSSNGYRCMSCSSLSSLHCANCTSDGLSCFSCDTGYVFINAQCVSIVPDGYVNISGNATPCSSLCLTCSITVSNCTSCPSSSTLYNFQCVSQCPSPLILFNSTCVSCTVPCTTCSSLPSRCTSCASPYFLNVASSQCVSASGCQSHTYPNSTANLCSQCISPCLSCSTALNCSSCVHGFYFESLTTLCLDVCPLGWVGVVDICIRCTSPCRYCTDSPDNCTSCISGYYWNSYTFQCLLQCPALVSIANPVSMTCQLCAQSCTTCQNLTILCLSCSSPLFLSGNQCVSTCTTGLYGDNTSRTCKTCDSSCLTCSTMATTCLSCPAGSYLYLASCVASCPATEGIIVAQTCQPCTYLLSNCATCTSSQCLACTSSYLLVNGQCYSSCLAGYTLSAGSCITTTDSATQQLTNVLSSSGVFPLPWTCIGVSLFIACLMSKLQNKNTYLTGAAYSVSGILETGSLVFMVIKYITYNRSLQATQTAVPTVSQFPLLTVGLIIILILNVTSLIVQTPLLCLDQKFQSWYHKHVSHRVMFALTTILSLLVNYKVRLIIFSKLFSITSTRAQLESVQKFRIFNILSFLGVSHEIFVIYMASVMISRITTHIITNEMFLIYIDGIAVCLLAMGLSIATNKKDEDFFTEIADNGYVLNKKIMVEGDEMVQYAIQARHLRGQENKQSLINKKSNQMDSFQNMMQSNDQQIYEDEELSLSISQNRSEIDRREKQKQRSKQNQSEQSQQGTNILNNYSKSNAKKIKSSQKQGAHVNETNAHEDTGNPINRAKYQMGDKVSEGSDQANNHAQNGRKSVIFQQNNKQYNQQDVISKNRTVLIDNTSKVEYSEKSSIKVNNFLQQTRMPDQNSSNKNKIQNETKVYRDPKDIEVENSADQIQSKIQKKKQQLLTLKRQNSNKALHRSREKSRQKPSSLKPEVIFKKPKVQNALVRHETKLDLQKQQLNKIQKSKQIGDQNIKVDTEVELKKLEQINKSKDKKQILNIYKDYDQGDNVIPEVSMLIRQEKELKQQKLRQQKAQDIINEDIQLITSQQLQQHKIVKNQESLSNAININESIVSQANTKNQTDAEQKPKIQSIKELDHLHFNIQNMYDSILKADSDIKIKDSSKNINRVDNQVQEKQKDEQLHNIVTNEYADNIQTKQGNQKGKNNNKNIFEFQSDPHEQMDDSGLEDSCPNYEEEINNHPIKSSIELDKKSVQNKSIKNNKSIKQSLTGIIQNQSQRNKIPRMADEQVSISKNSQDSELKQVYGEQKTIQQKTTRKNQERPPSQRPVSVEKNRIYAAGLRQLQDQTIIKKHFNENPLQEKKLMKKSSLDVPSEEYQPNMESLRKRNGSVYNGPLNRLQSYDSKESSSQIHTQDFMIRPGRFFQGSNLNSSSDGSSFVRSNKNTVVGDSEVPQKPTISHNATARAKFNDSNQFERAATSQHRGGRNRMKGEQLTGDYTKQRINSKKGEQDEQNQDLDQFYGRSRQKSKSPKRSKTKERNPSKQSIKKMKELQKVYLQRLDLPKRRQ